MQLTQCISIYVVKYQQYWLLITHNACYSTITFINDTYRQYQLGSPVLSLSISCTSANCTNAIKEDGVQITIVHTFQVCCYTYVLL